MITGHSVELRIGARTLLHPSSFRIGAGDRIGLVGRNGAGKTTLTKYLARENPTTETVALAGQIVRTGDVGYLPQDTQVVDADMLAMDRVLSARGLDYLVRAMADTEQLMTSDNPDIMAAALDRYPKLEARFLAAGGYAAESEAHRITANLGLDDRVLSARMGNLSGGQRRRVELARILFSGAPTLLLDEPTNHLDADSITWLRDFLKAYPGGFIVISHDVDLLRVCVNKVWHLDANRGELDQYSLGWDAYLLAREQDEKRRRRERANAEKKAAALMAQAETMRAKATKAVAAQQMIKRAETLLRSTETERKTDKVAKLRFPTPAPCGRTPLTAEDLSKSYGSLEVFTGVDLAIDRGSRVVILGLNGAGKTTLLRILAGVEQPDTGGVAPGHGLKLGYYAQEHDTLDLGVTVVENLRHAAPDLTDTQVRSVLGSFLFSGDDADKPTHVLSGGEKTRLALATLVVSSANVLLLDEPTNNLDPASRAEILGALETYEGAVVMVTHDEGAVDALTPERVLLLPDGDEDLWTDSYRDLVTLA
ncbi:MAG: ATP-binding cassette domain-containing protein [Cellulomonadaceae bacterium]|nr:ATP-binding cassette domain-containing protein [Cellulomonadaceae bacterium]